MLIFSNRPYNNFPATLAKLHWAVYIFLKEVQKVPGISGNMAKSQHPELCSFIFVRNARVL